MRDPLLFAFGVHNHQPVGNFPEVIARAHRRAYAPFLETLRRHPGVNFSLHLSGSLWEWLADNASDTVELIRELAARGQCEILAGTYYEALAPVAPARDVSESITAYADALEAAFGARPRGMWLAERVYEPHLPELLAGAGIQYTAVDDWHFRAAGFDVAVLDRPWLAEHQGATVALCPISQRLRYLVPFAAPEEVLAHFRELYDAGAQMTCLADDGEKFGEWPRTHEHCYRNGWLERFLALVDENRAWLRTTTLGEAVATVPAAGPAYLPATSYYEMTRWAMPTAAQQRLAALGNDFASNGAAGDLAPGASFRSFFHKYPEVNFFHKRVQEVSRRAAAADDLRSDIRSSLRRHLWRAQANDAYWHGVFGGCYLPHLRRGVKEELLSAEALLDNCLGTTVAEEVCDFDADGGLEVTLKNDAVVAVLKAAEGLAAAEFSRRSPPTVLTDVASRRAEPYHAEVGKRDDGALATIHAPRADKEPGLERLLVYDRRPRYWGLDRLLAAEAALAAYAAEEAVEWVDVAWTAAARAKTGWDLRGTWRLPEGGDVAVDKTISLTAAGLEFRFRVESELLRPVRYGLEFSLSLTSAEEGGAVVDASGPRPCSEVWEAAPAREVRLVDRSAGWEVRLEAEPAALAWHVPLYTVSCSESGFEKVYQGSSLFLSHELPAGKNVLAGRCAAAVT